MVNETLRLIDPNELHQGEQVTTMPACDYKYIVSTEGRIWERIASDRPAVSVGQAMVDGDPVVTLFDRWGDPFEVPVRYCVADAWLLCPMWDQYRDVMHLNRNKSDCRLKNLRVYFAERPILKMRRIIEGEKAKVLWMEDFKSRRANSKADPDSNA
jgi:hypothetical protein